MTKVVSSGTLQKQLTFRSARITNVQQGGSWGPGVWTFDEQRCGSVGWEDGMGSSVGVAWQRDFRFPITLGCGGVRV